MKIEEVLPYFLIKVNNEKEFVDLQTKLFAKGYKWIDDSKIFIHNILEYPLFISNIPDDENEKRVRLRNTFKEFKNNIFYFREHTIKSSYNKQILRKAKLNNLTFL